MPATARRLVRKMRGGAQAHLVEADDGHFYVVKFRNNPQGRRILVNEWFGSVMLRHLGIACAEPAIVHITDEFLRDHPETAIQFGGRSVAPQAGWHFGSRYPGHPDRIAVYDFIPDMLLKRVENLHEFLGMLAFDKWAGNADARQSVFLRARVRDYAPALLTHPLRVGFVTVMIDHGYLFNGPHWDFMDSAATGLYFRPVVYRNVRGLDSFEPWLQRIQNFPEEVLDDALKQTPLTWLNGDSDQLVSLLERLMLRRKRVPELIQNCRRASVNPFPQWAEASA
jgi:hypothetical protein